ncbi:MAG: response regulator transcription factor [Gammaproteobacteria bacterium]|nr:response regulator transcription factor [Gammaproteobacteria bacterium]
MLTGEDGELVYVVDDDASARESLCWLLNTEGIGTRAFPSSETFLEDWRVDWRGCIMLDVRMPGMDGLSLLEVLKARNNALPVIVLTGHADVAMAIHAMKSGAYDFLEKPYSDDELLAAVGAALDRNREHAREVVRTRRTRIALDGLTPREREVLELIVEGLTNKGIADRLGISERTVEVHRSRIMSKSGAGSLSELVRMWLETSEPTRRDTGFP